jgi:hypothetical protein
MRQKNDWLTPVVVGAMGSDARVRVLSSKTSFQSFCVTSLPPEPASAHFPLSTFTSVNVGMGISLLSAPAGKPQRSTNSVVSW